MIGLLKFWKGNYGFLAVDDKEYFVHVSAFAGKPGEFYQFDLIANDRHPGQQMAANVHRHAPDKQAGTDAAWEQNKHRPITPESVPYEAGDEA